MSHITYIKNKSEIPLEEGWVTKKSFKNQGSDKTHNGHTYTLEAKQRFKYAGWERAVRVLIGLLSVLLSLGGSLASKHIRQLFYKEDKYSRIFAVLKFGNENPPFRNLPQRNSTPSLEESLSHSSNSIDPDQPLCPRANSSDSSSEVDPTPEPNSKFIGSKNDSKENESALRFYSEVEQMSFWESYLSIYSNALQDEKWDSIPALFFLHDELQGIGNSLKQLKREVEVSINEFVETKKLKSADENEASTYSSLKELRDRINTLIADTDQSLSKLNQKIEHKLNAPTSSTTPPQAHPKTPPSALSKSTIAVKGIGNAGSTCYINSALQPLLAARIFSKLIPDQVSAEPAESFADRQAILDAFKFFIAAREAQMSAADLGQCIAELRRRIFEAGLQEGGFVNRQAERRFQDAGQFFELLLHIIHGGFELEITKTPVLDDGRQLDYRTRTEATPQGVFYLQAPGGTVQEMVEGHRETIAKQFDPGNEWRVQHPDTYKEIYLANYVERQKITSNPPEILVVRVNNRVVDPTVDKDVNFEALFDNPSPEVNYEYELVGFSQNHSQVHWTSVVWDEKHWQHCDDSKVTPVDPSHRTFRHPANYMVYKKKETY